jgi:hypothetical protein
MKDRQVSNLLQAFYNKTTKDQSIANVLNEDSDDFNHDSQNFDNLSKVDCNSPGLQKIKKYLNSYA